MQLNVLILTGDGIGKPATTGQFGSAVIAAIS